MIKPVGAEKPENKPSASDKQPSKLKTLALKSDKRIQTAEGWKRTKLKTDKTKKPD
jgi:hypothetical protein